MQIKKEIFTDSEDPNYWYAKGYDIKGNVIWSLEFGFGMHFKLFKTYKYDNQNKLIEEIIERSERSEVLWFVESQINYEYKEHKNGDQLKICETVYYTESNSRRLIIVEDFDIVLPDPLYPNKKRLSNHWKKKGNQNRMVR